YLPPGVDWPDQEGLPVQCHRELHISAATLDLDADPVSHPPHGGLAELVSDRHALLCSDDGPVQLAHQEQRSSEVEECKRENALSAARPSLASEAHRAFATFHTGLCVAGPALDCRQVGPVTGCFSAVGPAFAETAGLQDVHAARVQIAGLK